MPSSLTHTSWGLLREIFSQKECPEITHGNQGKRFFTNSLSPRLSFAALLTPLKYTVQANLAGVSVEAAANRQNIDADEVNQLRQVFEQHAENGVKSNNLIAQTQRNGNDYSMERTSSEDFLLSIRKGLPAEKAPSAFTRRLAVKEIYEHLASGRAAVSNMCQPSAPRDSLSPAALLLNNPTVSWSRPPMRHVVRTLLNNARV